MVQQTLSRPNPKRVAAGRRNRKLRGPLTEAGRERLREAALRNRPWLKSTGPRSAAGKARSAANGRKRQQAGPSLREIRADLADTHEFARQLAELRRSLTGS